MHLILCANALVTSEVSSATSAKPLKSKNARVVILPRLTTTFAYFLGYLLGDGCTSISGHPTVSISCHSIDEDDLARRVIVPLITRLFGIRPSLFKKRNQNAYCISFGSKQVVTYLTDVVGFPLGQFPKVVPRLISSSRMRIKVAFVRGLFDADGSIILSKKTYQNPVYPSIELKSVDRNILQWVMGVLKEQGFRVSQGRSAESWVLRVNGSDMLVRWMRKIGSGNLKHISKYQVWQKYGYCPPNTNVPQRLDLLRTSPNSGKTNINSSVAVGLCRGSSACPGWGPWREN